MSNFHVWILIAVIAIVTALLRFLPFIVFRNTEKTPKIIKRLSRTLPYAIMSMLVVYCLKEISFTSAEGFLPYIISSIVVALPESPLSMLP
jgi:branched-subunit amino acid transport protein AzlD